MEISALVEASWIPPVSFKA